MALVTSVRISSSTFTALKPARITANSVASLVSSRQCKAIPQSTQTRWITKVTEVHGTGVVSRNCPGRAQAGISASAGRKCQQPATWSHGGAKTSRIGASHPLMVKIEQLFTARRRHRRGPSSGQGIACSRGIGEQEITTRAPDLRAVVELCSDGLPLNVSALAASWTALLLPGRFGWNGLHSHRRRATRLGQRSNFRS